MYSNQANLGGGLYIEGTATLTNTNVYSNQADSYGNGSGGGVYVLSNGVANFESCNIHDNTAFSTHYGYGGGLYIEGTATLTNTNVYSNTATWGVLAFVPLLQTESLTSPQAAISMTTRFAMCVAVAVVVELSLRVANPCVSCKIHRQLH